MSGITQVGSVMIRFGADAGGLLAGVGLVSFALKGLSTLVPALMGGFKAGFGLIGTGLADIGFGIARLASNAGIGFASILGGVQNVGKGLGQVALSLIGSLALLGAAIVAVGAIAAIALGVTAVKAAMDFQKQMNENIALAGLSKSSFDSMTASLLKLAGVVGLGPTQLAQAMYWVLSASIPASKAVETVKVAAELAASGMSDLQTTTQALTTVMKVFGMSATEAGNYITVAVTSGKMNMQQFAQAIGTVSLTGQQAKMTFAEVAAALDTLTAHGFPSAAQAGRNLGQLFTEMDIKVDTVAAKAKSLGLAFDETKFKTMSLSQQVAYLNDVTKGNVGQLTTLLSGSIYAVRAFEALKNGASDYTAILNKLNASQQGAGALAAAFATTQGGLAFQLQRLGAAAQAAQVAVGLQLLPYVTKLAEAVVPIVTQFANWIISTNAVTKAMQALAPIAQGFAQGFMAVWTPATKAIGEVLQKLGQLLQWMGQNKEMMEAFKGIAIALGAAIAVILLAALLLAIASLATLATIVGVVAGAIAGIIYVVEHFGEWMSALGKLIHDVVIPKIGEAFSWLGTIAHDAVGKVGDAFSWLGTMAHDAIGKVGDAFSWLGTMAHDAIGKIGDLFSGLGTQAHNAVGKVGDAFSGLGTQAHDAVTTVGGWFQWLYDHDWYVMKFVVDIKYATAQTVAFLKTAWADTINWLSQSFKYAAGQWGQTFSDLGTVSHRAWDWIKNDSIQSWSIISNSLKSTWDDLTKFHQQSMQSMVDKNKRSTQQIEQDNSQFGQQSQAFFKNLWSGITSDTGNFFSGLGSVVHDGLQHVESSFSEFGQWIGNLFSNLGKTFHDAGAKLIGALAQGIKDGAGAVGQAIHDAISSALAALGFHNIPGWVGNNPPGFAAGVQNFRGGLAMVGEMGPELVYLPQGSSVYTTSQLASMFAPSNAGGTIITSGGAGGSSGQISAIVAAVVAAMGAGGQQIIEMDGRQVAKIVGPHMAQQKRVKLAIRGSQ